MKKTICILTALMIVLSLTACSSGKQETKTVTETETAAAEGFRPSLDASAECRISVAGGYDNFETLEAEFDSFNEY